jgi:dTMP kinase
MNDMKLIAFCGMDGSGKSTQSKLLEEHLKRQKIPTKRVHLFSEGGTAAARLESGSLARRALLLLRKLPTTGLVGVIKAIIGGVAFTMDAWITYFQFRRDHPNEILVADRYFYDHVATFASRYPNGLRWFLKIARLMPRPDVVFVFLVEPELSFQRKGEYTIELLATFRNNYLLLSKQLECCTYDGADEISSIAQDIIRQVSMKLS